MIAIFQALSLRLVGIAIAKTLSKLLCFAYSRLFKCTFEIYTNPNEYKREYKDFTY